MIHELSEEIDRRDIREDILPLAARADIQRLGYLWDSGCGRPALADALYRILKKESPLLKRYKLDPSKPLQDWESANRWKIDVNTEIEIDE